jgi:hypothetical protein
MKKGRYASFRVVQSSPITSAVITRLPQTSSPIGFKMMRFFNIHLPHNTAAIEAMTFAFVTGKVLQYCTDHF